MTIGQQLSKVLKEIEWALWEFEACSGTKPGYSDEGFRAATKIFMSALMDKMWEIQQSDKMDMTDRENMAEKAGEEVRKLIKTYTGIESHDWYNKKDTKINSSL